MNDANLNACPCGPGCGCEPCNCAENAPTAEGPDEAADCCGAGCEC